ncbi:UNVERIFIED_CONTAM: hypothetical protein FKN15_016057 [Acipenser sinensis]
MRKTTLLAIFTGVLLYLVGGALVFQALEKPRETQQHGDIAHKKALFLGEHGCVSPQRLDQLIEEEEEEYYYEEEEDDDDELDKEEEDSSPERGKRRRRRRHKDDSESTSGSSEGSGVTEVEELNQKNQNQPGPDLPDNSASTQPLEYFGENLAFIDESSDTRSDRLDQEELRRRRSKRRKRQRERGGRKEPNGGLATGWEGPGRNRDKGGKN